METSKTIVDLAPALPKPGVLATITKVTGSHPQEVGAKMWVTADQFFGTLGGGEFELRVLNYSRELLQSPQPEKAHIKEYVLCKEMGQCCGGRAEVFFEIASPKKMIHLFGGGHVGRAVSHVLSQMPFDISLIDSRPEWSSRRDLPNDIRAHHADPLAYAQSRAWSANDAVCIFTHSHDLDYLLVKYFLEQPVGYLGLIGSGHKAKIFQARLESENPNLPGLWEKKMRCPIGIPLPSKNPKIIAVSIAAELIKEWGLRHLV